MSSTDTLGSECLLVPSRNSTAEVAALMPQASGRAIQAKSCIAGAARRAKASAFRRASRFGTSSPRSSVTKERSITNTVSAIGRATAATAGGAWSAIHTVNSLTSRSPP